MKKEVKKQNKIVKQGDKVLAIAGNHRGMTGTVLHVGLTHATVQGLNMKKKHVRKTQENPSGGIIELEKPIHLSNLALCNDKDQRFKTKIRVDQDGGKHLVNALSSDKKSDVIRTIKKPNTKR